MEHKYRYYKYKKVIKGQNGMSLFPTYTPSTSNTLDRYYSYLMKNTPVS